MIVRRPMVSRLLGLLPVLAVVGCGFSPPQTEAQRDASQSCGHEADRIYSAQNRYQLSERESRDTPFSGDTPRPLPSDGLADRYAYDQMVSTCLKRSEAVPVTAQTGVQ